ncbi:glycoside hydrolase family 31 protein [Filimonas effusa]|uniref:DUF5110 domain-containing protein n=1 Tax=Filimonas effusa TaxID=2508721 RepID=A0A4Q1DAK1_9BACT|nr:TIM-barrel domain-containing protein [Filimonas effusa]RXK85509.1 DUF5110 domain-containing protein [Filimonas effusa]
MKQKILFLACVVPVLLYGQQYQKHTVTKDKVSIQLPEGILSLIPVSNKAIRVQWEKDLRSEAHEFVFEKTPPSVAFTCSETAGTIQLKTNAVFVTFHKKNGVISFSDKNGKVLLSETAGSRTLIADTISGNGCYIATQGFATQPDEYLFGLGQFQDGHYNLKNITRKLTQVNTQIAIPFLYSSKGYGILWHQYGLTYFNPADNDIILQKRETASSDKSEVEVTTTAGTQRVSQQQAAYTGKFSISQTGDYSLMLDLGDMDNRHLVIVDGITCIDQSNLWLPPAASKLVRLSAGEHTVQVVCKATNTPHLSLRPASDTTVFRSPHAKSLDYIVFVGKDADEVIADYRNLSGNVPMLPLWAYGFWQCRERYTSGQHLVETVKEFRKKRLPMDVIVQDWQYWGKYGWGVPKFDEANYPEPEKFIQQLHEHHARLSVSVWENLDKKSEVAKPYITQNLYIPNSPWIDIYNPLAGKTHWNALNSNLFSKGVDSWWMDATEPENDALAGKQTYFGPGYFYRLTYPLFVSKAVYEGQRTTDAGKRVAILTRSAFAGQQRYGTINWSGDIGWSWDTYKRQIVAGLNYSLTGMPYWTTDIGGFFRPGRSQYSDPAYHEILTRWFQWGTFNSIFRMHGYQSETEPWKYGDTVEANMRTMLDLRYRLLPYIYSEAWQVHEKGSTIMRPLVMDFAYDKNAVAQAYEYMFGKSLLVAPVTAPGVKQWRVYLPEGQPWYDFWTGKRINGGQTISATAPADKIPLFAKAGAIIPMGKFMQYTSEKTMDTVEIRIYTGADGHFSLYSDEGDNYNYEKGKHALISMKWNDKQQTLHIDKRQGSYNGMLKKQVFHIVCVNELQGHGLNLIDKNIKTTVEYTGEAISMRLPFSRKDHL